jgi:hypothetical protein
MAQKKTLRKKKRIRRPGRLLLLVLALAAALGLILFLVLRPADEPTAQVSPAGDGLWDGSWYEDDLGRIEKDKALVKGMAAFEKKTGVRPFLTLLNGIDPEELYVFVQDQYEALFSEGDHLLVVYDEWESEQYYLLARTGADSALSDADVTMVLACLEQAYADPANRSYAEAFGAGFAQGARKVSAVKGAGGAMTLLILGLVLLCLGVALILVLRKKALDDAR